MQNLILYYCVISACLIHSQFTGVHAIMKKQQVYKNLTNTFDLYTNNEMGNASFINDRLFFKVFKVTLEIVTEFNSIPLQGL